jgi:UDP-glucose 4-epimerase
LKCMKKHNINNLIFSSSCTVYGQADELPITEQTPIKPAESVYGRTKQICENMISDFHAEFDFNSILLRYFNPIGAHETGLIGESPNGIPDNLIPYVTQTAIGIRKELTVFGTDYDTKDGTCVRDYIHVVDLAKAHVCAITATNNKKYIAEPINLGTGNGYTVKEVLNAFEEYNDVILNIKFGERRSGDVTSAFANADYAYSELNWKAELGLKEMVKSAWLWEKNLKKKCCNNCKCSK